MVILVQIPFLAPLTRKLKITENIPKLAQQTVSAHHHMLLIEVITFFSFTLDFV